MKRLTLLLAFIAIVLTGCGELVNNATGARIANLTITPDTITATDTGMTDEFFTATMVVEGFVDPVDPDTAVIFLQEPNRLEAQPQSRSIDGNTITLDGIAKTWVGGLDPGVYPVGGEVRSETESVTQLDLATITIEE